MANIERSVEWIESESDKNNLLPTVNNDTTILEFLNDVPLMTQVQDLKEDEILMNLTNLEESFEIESSIEIDLIKSQVNSVGNNSFNSDSIDINEIETDKIEEFPKENEDSFNSDFSIETAELDFISEEEIEEEFLYGKIEKKVSFDHFDVISCKEINKNSGKIYKIRVYDNWRSINFTEGMVIKIIKCSCCKNPSRNLNFIDNDHNLILIEGDMMTVTNLINCFECNLRGFLQQNVADINFKYLNKNLITGIAIHKILQEIITKRCSDIKFISEILNVFIKENVVNLYRCNIIESELRNDVLKQINNIIEFSGKIENVKSVEFNLISKLFDLKGNIDVLSEKCVVEVKAGKFMHCNHRAQVLLYSLMLSDIKSEKLKIPIIFYTLSGTAHQISVQHSEMRDLVIKKNQIVSHQLTGSMASTCRCDHIDLCTVFKSVMDFDKDHFLRISLIDTLKSIETVKFYDIEDFQVETDFFTFKIPKTISIEEQDRILLYNFNKKFICKVKIDKIENSKIFFSKSHQFNFDQKLYFSIRNNEMFNKFTLYSILNVAYFIYKGNPKENYLPVSGTEEISIEFSEVEFEGKNNLKYFNMSSSNFINSPTQDKKVLKTLPIPDLYKNDFFNLNEFQQKALVEALNCCKYQIIHGMPGTGKSTLIALLIKILVFYNKKILLICYTHLALENLLGKLSNLNWYKANSSSIEKESVKELNSYFNSFDVVAGTCYSFNDPIFVERKFDFCVIDEGSQINLLLTLIPLSISSRFVIVGDHLQINPIKGNKISLFEHLYYKGEFSELKIQYRMGRNIMKLSNQLFYNNKMHQGNKIEGKVVFVDSSKEELKSFVSNLPKCTILCYFNNEVEKIKEMTDFLVTTIDKFQGSEDDFIVVVFDPVLGNDCQLSENRLNVALTRAKKQLILYGNRREMEKVKIFKKLIDLL